VIFALLRYAYQVHRGLGEDVSRDLLRDPWILGAGAAWLLVFLWPLLITLGVSLGVTPLGLAG